jgi:Tfp pilus assembly protein PilF
MNLGGSAANRRMIKDPEPSASAWRLEPLQGWRHGESHYDRHTRNQGKPAMHGKWIILSVLMLAVSCAQSPPPDPSQCVLNSRIPAIGIIGCTAIIESGKETGEKLAGFYNRRGVLRERTGQHGLAIQDLEDAIRLSPNNPYFFNNRGVFYYNEGSFDRAIQDFDQALRIDPKHAMSYNSRGGAYRSKGQYERAIQDFDEAILLKPANSLLAGSYKNRGLAFLDLGQRERAAADFAKARQLDPSLPTPPPNAAELPRTTHTAAGCENKSVQAGQSLTLRNGDQHTTLNVIGGTLSVSAAAPVSCETSKP